MSPHVPGLQWTVETLRQNVGADVIEGVRGVRNFFGDAAHNDTLADGHDAST